MDGFLRMLEKSVTGLMLALALPIGMLNTVGGIASGIWLAILGKWALIGLGLILGLISSFGLGILMTFRLAFLARATAMLERGDLTRAYISTILSWAYSVTVLAAWCISVFALYTRHADKNSLIPVLIWSYSVAATPVSALAYHDLRCGVENTEILAFFTFIACIIASLAIFSGGFSLHKVFSIFASVMFIALITLFSNFYLARKSQENY